MIRVSMEPEQRKRELVKIAEELFIRNGYDETAVSDIVKAAGVAQGTFYYYFRSKDEVRNAVINHNILEVREMIDRIMAMEGMNALERMGAFSMAFSKWSEGKGRMMDYLHEEKNEILHYRMSRKVLEYLVPAYTAIIEQGIKENIFHTEYPGEAAQALMGMTENVLEGRHSPDMGNAETRRKYIAMLEFSERILGAEPGIFVKFAKEKGVDI